MNNIRVNNVCLGLAMLTYVYVTCLSASGVLSFLTHVLVNGINGTMRAQVNIPPDKTVEEERRKSVRKQNEVGAREEKR